MGMIANYQAVSDMELEQGFDLMMLKICRKRKMQKFVI